MYRSMHINLQVLEPKKGEETETINYEAYRRSRRESFDHIA